MANMKKLKRRSAKKAETVQNAISRKEPSRVLEELKIKKTKRRSLIRFLFDALIKPCCGCSSAHTSQRKGSPKPTKAKRAKDRTIPPKVDPKEVQPQPLSTKWSDQAEVSTSQQASSASTLSLSQPGSSKNSAISLQQQDSSERESTSGNFLNEIKTACSKTTDKDNVHIIYLGHTMEQTQAVCGSGGLSITFDASVKSPQCKLKEPVSNVSELKQQLDNGANNTSTKKMVPTYSSDCERKQEELKEEALDSSDPPLYRNTRTDPPHKDLPEHLYTIREETEEDMEDYESDVYLSPRSRIIIELEAMDTDYRSFV